MSNKRVWSARLLDWLRDLFARNPKTVVNNYFTIVSEREPSRIAREVVEAVKAEWPRPPAV